MDDSRTLDRANQSNDNAYSQEEIMEFRNIIDVISQLDKINENNELFFPYLQMIPEFLENHPEFRIVDYFKKESYVIMIYLLNQQKSYIFKYQILSIFTFVTLHADKDLASFLVSSGLIDCLYNLKSENDTKIQTFLITIAKNLFEFLTHEM